VITTVVVAVAVVARVVATVARAVAVVERAVVTVARVVATVAEAVATAEFGPTWWSERYCRLLEELLRGPEGTENWSVQRTPAVEVVEEEDSPGILEVVWPQKDGDAAVRCLGELKIRRSRVNREPEIIT
jgi:hypothetical protein